MRRLLAYVVVVLCAWASVGASPAVSLKVSPRVSSAPVTLRFTVTIEPNATNRKACLVFDGGEFGMSCWQVDGDTHPRTQWFERHVGAAGEYYATLTLVSIVCDAQQHCSVQHTTAVTTFIISAPGVPFVR